MGVTKYYFSTAGDDSSGNGTPAAPWATFAKLLASVPPGNVALLLRGDVWDEELSVPANVTVGVYGNVADGRAVIDRGDVASTNGIVFQGSQNAKVSNVEVRACGAEGVKIEGDCDGLVLENVFSHDNGSHGFWGGGGGGSGLVTFRECEAADNAEDGFAAENDFNFLIDGGSSHGHNASGSDGVSTIDDAVASCQRMEIYDNEDGIHFGNDNGDVFVNRCHVHSNIDHQVRYSPVAYASGRFLAHNTIVIMPASASADDLGGFFCEDGFIEISNCAVYNQNTHSTNVSFCVRITGGEFLVGNCIFDGVNNANAKYFEIPDPVGVAHFVDYNAYDTTGSLNRWKVDGTVINEATWKAILMTITLPFDANGVFLPLLGLLGDPVADPLNFQLVHVTGVGLNPLVGGGTNVGNTFTDDYFGNKRSRFNEGQWDIGPFAVAVTGGLSPFDLGALRMLFLTDEEAEEIAFAQPG